MTDLDDLTLAHLVTITNDPGPGRPCRAECSCGWTGERHDDQGLAELESDDHRSVAVGPADEMDRTISGLLDLQDDLALAVMWLAENWSADLPVPSDLGTGGPAEVLLLASCADDDELTRAADVLGIELVDDATPTSTGARYRRGRRRFGARVTLQVYRQLDQACARCGTLHTTWSCPRCGQRHTGRTVEAA